MVGLGVISFVSGYWRRFTGQRISLDVQYDLRNSVFEHLQRLDFAAHDNMQTGQLMSRATADVTLLERFLAQLPNTLGNIVQVVVAIIAMLFLSPPLTLVALLCIPTLLGLATHDAGEVVPRQLARAQRQADVAGVVEEAVSGVRVVKAFGQEQRELAAARRARPRPVPQPDARRCDCRRATNRRSRRSRRSRRPPSSASAVGWRSTAT